MKLQPLCYTQVELPERADHIDNRILAAGTADSVTIPTGAKGVIFGFADDTWVKIGGSGTAATVPSADTTDGSGSMFNPTGRMFRTGDTIISLICASDSKCSLEYV